MDLELVKNEPKYYEFIRALRTNEAVQAGFIEQASITPEQQQRYMAEHGDDYMVCLGDGSPAGYIGEIDGDIRVATHPDFQRKGVALFMLKQFVALRSGVFAKVKLDNEASKRLFERAGFRPKYIIYEPENED